MTLDQLSPYQIEPFPEIRLLFEVGEAVGKTAFTPYLVKDIIRQNFFGRALHIEMQNRLIDQGICCALPKVEPLTVIATRFDTIDDIATNKGDNIICRKEGSG
jgi:hypothetical protein